MPPLESMDRNGWAVVFPFVGRDEYGQPLYGEAEEIEVRWIHGRSKVQDREGNTVVLDGTLVAGAEIGIDSQLWEGRLADWLGTGSGNPDEALLVVKSCHRAQDLKGRVVRYEIGWVFKRHA